LNCKSFLIGIGVSLFAFILIALVVGQTGKSANAEVALGGSSRMVSIPNCYSNWMAMTSANAGLATGSIQSVDAVSSNDVWAVGYYSLPGKVLRTLTWHWDGTAWSVVDSPNQGTGYNYLGGVGVVSANDVWAVGYNYGPLVEHWDTGPWIVVPSSAAMTRAW